MKYKIPGGVRIWQYLKEELQRQREIPVRQQT
jgi:hypothetical protein